MERIYLWRQHARAFSRWMNYKSYRARPSYFKVWLSPNPGNDSLWSLLQLRALLAAMASLRPSACPLFTL
ncbi:hypothetical protein LZ554_003160 [Drepanopeziza brunnea f. sp. 'monogermtubi']|nr:hypothetical protein LZ554_003160 [Drepanopeziza brunnea f. sp. 'monogermtubi']